MDVDAQTTREMSLRERQKQHVRAELLSAAMRLIEERGVEAVAVDDIVGAAGVAKGTFYLHFKTKSEIVEAVATLALDELATRVSEALDAAPEDAPDELRAVTSALLDFLDRHQGMAKLLMEGRIFDDPQISSAARGELRTRFDSCTLQYYDRIIRKGMLQRHYREVDARTASVALLGIIRALAEESRRLAEPLPEVCSFALEMLHRGISFR